jgi:hypothetical protein
MIELQQDNRAEYEALTTEERQELVNEYVSQKGNYMKIRVNARSRLLDVMNITRNMQQLVSSRL